MKPEEFEQIWLMDWSHTQKEVCGYLLHIRNEGKRTPGEGVKAVRMGLKKGVSDLFLARPTDKYAGFWIELKTPKTPTRKSGVASKEQLAFLELMRGVGYKAEVYWGWIEAAKAITDYLGLARKI